MPLKSSSTKSNCAWRRETCAFAKSESNVLCGSDEKLVVAELLVATERLGTVELLDSVLVVTLEDSTELVESNTF